MLSQGGVKSTVSGVFENLKLKISEEILNLKSSNTDETLGQTPL